MFCTFIDVCLILGCTHREYDKCHRPFDLSGTWETWACVQFSSTRLRGHTVYHLVGLEWLVQPISVPGCVWAWCSFPIYWVYNLSSLVILLTRTSVKDWTAFSSFSIVNVMFWWTPCSANSSSVAVQQKCHTHMWTRGLATRNADQLAASYLAHCEAHRGEVQRMQEKSG